LNNKINVLVASTDLKLGIKIFSYLKVRNCNVRNLNHCFITEKFLSKIEEFKPDILIYDAQLFTCDIVWLTNKIKKIQNNICQIILMPRRDWRIEKLSISRNVSYLYIPYNFCDLYEKIVIQNSAVNRNSIPEMIHFFLKNLGVSEKLYGFEYICSAISIILFEHSKFTKLTRDIYPEIALRHGSNYSNVERCIRNCINVFMKNAENRKYFYYIASKYGNFSKDFNVTNSKFLNILAITFKNYYM